MWQLSWAENKAPAALREGNDFIILRKKSKQKLFYGVLTVDGNGDVILVPDGTGEEKILALEKRVEALENKLNTLLASNK
ncbi:MAG: hypothetical protein HY063_06010 [Bacteroidetes bacterium]|nr:hypothetical protein [Bacteroidota bacterium]